MTGIILAGGKSRRMGKDKAELPWQEGTLLTATVEKLSIFCKEIVIVGPRRALEREVCWTEDRYVGKGPLAGLQAGLEAASFGSALVLPCDMPTVPLCVLEELVLLSKDVDIVIPVHAEGNEPLCAWYSKGACLPVIRELLESGYTSLLDILPRVRTVKMEVEKLLPQVPVKKIFANLNSPQDYAAAQISTLHRTAGVNGRG